MRDLSLLVVFFLIICHINAQEGRVLWSKPNIGDNLEAIPAVDAFGNVYILAGDKLYSYTASGEQRWNKSSRSAVGGDASSISVSMDNNRVYAPGIDGIRAFNAVDGTLIWSSKTFFSEKFGSVVCESIDGTTLYVGSGADHIGSETEYIYAINASTGDYLWRKAVDFSEWPECCRGFMAGCSIDTLGNVYLTGQNGVLYSFKDNRMAYTENWTFNLGTESRMPVAIDNKNGLIYACSNSSVIYKLDMSGFVLDSRNLEAGEVFAALVLSPDGQTIYVNAEDAKLHALSTLDFTEKWAYTFESWGSDPLVRDDGVVIVMGQVRGAARVCAIRDDITSGKLLWSSDKIMNRVMLNETNVNIGPEGNIYVHSGEGSPRALFAIEGNGKGLSVFSPWPKIMGNMQNNGKSSIVQEIKYTLDTHIIGNGSISVSSSEDGYNAGSLVTVTAMPAPGYKFDSWIGDLTGSLNPSIITMNGSKTITANFIPVNTTTTWYRIDDSDPAVSYTASWSNNISNPTYYLNTAKFTDDSEGAVSYNFIGSQAKIFILRTSDLTTTIAVTLDGVEQGEFTIEPGDEEIVEIYNSGFIPHGSHTISFVNRSPELTFDYLEYLGESTLGLPEGNGNGNSLFNCNIYPNPLVDNMLHIKIIGIQGVAKVLISDVNGRSLISQSFQTGDQKIIQMELSDLGKGIFFVKIVSEDHGSLVKKIILK
jgi:Divergent InlB B-repeat domain/PQQ-like domain/Secretion system C-terminal sorting domain